MLCSGPMRWVEAAATREAARELARSARARTAPAAGTQVTSARAALLAAHALSHFRLARPARACVPISALTPARTADSLPPPPALPSHPRNAGVQGSATPDRGPPPDASCSAFFLGAALGLTSSQYLSGVDAVDSQ